MKTLTWIFVFIISLTALIPKSDISQLSLLGNLYTHFSDYHANESQDPAAKAFINFIAEHYNDIQHEHQDEEEHEELPFKEFTSSGFYVLIKQNLVNPVCNHYIKEFICTNTDFYPIGFSASIDHPPSV